MLNMSYYSQRFIYWICVAGKKGLSNTLLVDCYFSRAYLKANNDKSSLVEQKKAAGMYNEWFERVMEESVINK